MPRPAERDSGGVERVEVAHDGLAKAHDARLFQRRELLAFVFDEHVDGMHRLERAADTARPLACSSNDDAELAEALSHQRRDDVAFSNLYRADDEGIALELRHTLIIEAPSTHAEELCDSTDGMSRPRGRSAIESAKDRRMRSKTNAMATPNRRPFSSRAT